MKTVEVNNQLGSRALKHVNLLLVPQQGIVEFQGRDIPPVARVLKESYKKDGKWSHYTWTVEIPDEFELLPFSQDWETGKYFPVNTWPEAIDRLNSKLDGKPARLGISPEQMERAIRSLFREAAEKIDAAETAFSGSGNVLDELLQAQDALAEIQRQEAEINAKIYQLEQAESLRQQAAETAARVAAAQNIMKSGKVSLADLKAAMAAT